MAQTVVGFFDNATEAQQAVQQLVSNGFSRDSIDINANASTGSVSNERREDDRENGITRFFKNLFGDNDEAETYSRVGQRSGSIVTVHARSSEEAERAADLLDDYGAVNVNEKASEYGYGSTGNTRSNSDSDTSIPVVQEELNIGKRTVETGGVRVRSRIVERPVEESIRLREENVTIERNAVNRPVSDSELENFREGEIELTERAEVPVVNKEARVVEEVRVSKEVTERNETINDTVRNTEVDVENLNRGESRTNPGSINDDLTSRNL